MVVQIPQIVVFRLDRWMGSQRAAGLPVLALVTSIVSWPLVMYEACISNGLIHSTNGLATKLCVWQPQQAVAWSAEEQRWSIGCIDKKTTLAIACRTWQVMRDTCFRSNGTPAQTRQAEEESRKADQDDALVLSNLIAKTKEVARHHEELEDVVPTISR